MTSAHNHNGGRKLRFCFSHSLGAFLRLVRRFAMIAFLCFPIFVVLGHKGFAEEVSAENGLAELELAIQRSRQSDYMAEFVKPELKDFPGVRRVVVWRRVSETGTVLLRGEFFGKNGLEWTFLQNAEGKFAISHADGRVACGGDFLRLYFGECLYNMPQQKELTQCRFEVEKRVSSQRQCRILRIETPGLDRKTEEEADEAYFQNLINIVRFDKLSDIKERHPFVREYVIDEETGTIVGLRKFNWFGKKLFHRAMTRVDFQPNWENHQGLFDTPNHIDYTVATTAQFIKKLKEERLLRPTAVQTESRRSRQQRKKNLDPVMVRYIILLAGLSFVGLAWWLRQRNN